MKRPYSNEHTYRMIRQSLRTITALANSAEIEEIRKDRAKFKGEENYEVRIKALEAVLRGIKQEVEEACISLKLDCCPRDIQGRKYDCEE